MALKPATGLSQGRIDRALDLLHAEYDNPMLDLRRAAAVVNLSSFHLSRVLKRATGKGFAQHLRSIRVKRAEELLRTTDLSVKQVAASVGYASTNALDRNFKTLLAVTPTVYRHATVGERGGRGSVASAGDLGSALAGDVIEV